MGSPFLRSLRAPGAIALLVCLALAGCAGGAEPKSPPTSSPNLPTHGPETGAIVGTVTDDELRPIAGARIGLLKEGLQTTSADNGSFAFGALIPGSYQVIVEALGFVGGGRRVDVVAGEATRADFLLAAIQVSGEPYLLALPRVIQINLDGPWSIDTTEGPYVNVSAFQDLRCSPCYGILYYSPTPEGTLSELRWTGTYVSPVTGTMIMRYVRNWTSDSGVTTTGTLVHRPILSNGGQALWPEAPVKDLKKAGDRVKFFLTIPRDSVALGVRVETWTTLSYNSPIPDEYSAFPPT